MKKLLVVLVVVGAISAGVCYWRFVPRAHTLTEQQLTFLSLEQVTMRDIVSATGLLEPRDTIVVSSEMPGAVQLVLGKINQIAQEGAVLVQLDERRLQLKKEEADNGVRTAKAMLVQAEATRDAAEIAFKYQLELASKGGFRSEREQAEAQFKGALAGVLAAQAKVALATTAVKEAQLALDMAQIKVPSVTTAGPKREYLILDCKVHDGQMVGPQSGPLFILAGGLERMEVHAQVAEGDINKVKPGQTAVFAVTTYADEEAEYRGVVKEIRPQATNIKGAVYYDTVIEVVNRRDPQSGEWQLRPGMNVSVDILRRERQNVWRVPVAALNFQLEEAYQSEAARARVAEWQKRPDGKNWHTLWTWDATKASAWPAFVRVNGLKNGEPGLKDEQGIEVLEWEPGQEPSHTPPCVIIAAPPAHRPGFFDKPANIKVS